MSDYIQPRYFYNDTLDTRVRIEGNEAFFINDKIEILEPINFDINDIISDNKSNKWDEVEIHLDVSHKIRIKMISIKSGKLISISD